MTEPFIMECDSSTYRTSWKKGVSMCMTCGRKDGHWISSRGRRVLKTEMMRLQGMDPKSFKVVVSETQLGKQLGNTMSVNVLERLLVRLLPAAGLARKGSLTDRWQDGSAIRELASTRSVKFAAAFCALGA